MDVTEVLHEYHLNFFERADIGDLLGNHFGPPVNPKRGFYLFILF